MKRFFSFLGLAAVLGGLFITDSSFAAVDLTDFTLDMTSVETMAGIIVGALAVMFGIRKIVKLANRS